MGRSNPTSPWSSSTVLSPNPGSCRRTRDRSLRVVGSPEHPEGAADLAHRAARAERLAQRRQQVARALRGLADGRERLGGGLGVPLRADAGGALALTLLGGRI